MINYNNVIVPNPLGLPNKFIKPLHFVELVDGHPLYTTDLPSKEEIREVGIFLLEEKGMDKPQVDYLCEMVSQVAMAATTMQVDGKSIPLILSPTGREIDPEVLAHELVHCEQMASGRLLVDPNTLIFNWEGEEFSQERIVNIQSWGESAVWGESTIKRLCHSFSFMVGQMFLPWEREAYEVNTNVNFLLDQVKRLAPDCPYL